MTMTHRTSLRMPVGRTALAVAAFLTLSGWAMVAQDAVAQDANVIARVDGEAITEADYENLRSGLSEQLSRVPAAQQRRLLIDELINRRLVAKAAIAAGMDKSETFQSQIATLREQLLRNAYFTEVIEAGVTDDDVKAAYEKIVAEFQGEDEIRARHILVESKEDAEAVIKELDEGKDFTELAKEKSTGPSGPNGGDLGFFAKGRMVPEFEAAAFAVAVGDYTKEPVKTQFGWHVIMVEELRKTEPPAFEEVRSQVRQSIVQTRVQEDVAKLREAAKIELTEADGETGDAPKKAE